MEGKSGDRKDRQASRQAGSAGRWIWQVRRAAVLAVQEGQRTRGATTDLDGCDRESILIVSFFPFPSPTSSHLHLHQRLPSATNVALLGAGAGPQSLRLLMPPARLVLAPASVTWWANCRQAPWSFLPEAPWPSEVVELAGGNVTHSLFAIDVALHAHHLDCLRPTAPSQATASSSLPARHPAHPVLIPPRHPSVMTPFLRSCPSA